MFRACSQHNRFAKKSHSKICYRKSHRKILVKFWLAWLVTVEIGFW